MSFIKKIKNIYDYYYCYFKEINYKLSYLQQRKIINPFFFYIGYIFKYKY